MEHLIDVESDDELVGTTGESFHTAFRIKPCRGEYKNLCTSARRPRH